MDDWVLDIGPILIISHKGHHPLSKHSIDYICSRGSLNRKITVRSKLWNRHILEWPSTDTTNFCPKDYKTTSLWKFAPRQVVKFLQNNNAAFNNHKIAITPQVRWNLLPLLLTEESELLLLSLLFIYSFKGPVILFFAWVGRQRILGWITWFSGVWNGDHSSLLEHSTMGNYRKLTAH